MHEQQIPTNHIKDQDHRLTADMEITEIGVRGTIQEVTSGKTEARSSARLHDDLLCDMELPFRENFYPIGYPIEILTNDSRVLESARESFGHARPSRTAPPLQLRIGVSHEAGPKCPPTPTRREFNHLYSLVADPDNQALLDLKTGISFAWLTQSAVNNRIYLRYNFLEKIAYLLLGASVVTDLHAACVSRNGKGILLCGDSGAGKSTLAYACARSGWTYTSDDTSYLINDSDPPRVIGHSHRARFRPSAKSLFPELEHHQVTPRLEGKPSIEVPISELPVPHAATEATVDFVVYLNRYPSAEAKLIALPNGTATQRACRDLYSAGEIRAKHERILEVFSAIPTYELQYCDLYQGVETLDRLTSKTLRRMLIGQPPSALILVRNLRFFEFAARLACRARFRSTRPRAAIRAEIEAWLASSLRHHDTLGGS